MARSMYETKIFCNESVQNEALRNVHLRALKTVRPGMVANLLVEYGTVADVRREACGVYM